MHHAYEAAQRAGADTVGLEVLIDNTEAIRLYERHGYVARGRRLSRGRDL